MNISFYSLSSHTISLFQEKFFSTLTAQQKKILMIASLAFGCLLACYYAIHHDWFKERDIQPQEPDIELEDDWWLKLAEMKTLKDFKTNWQNLTADPIKCESKSKDLHTHYIKYSLANLSGLDYSPLGMIYMVPNNFSMWMPGVAFVASYLTAKKTSRAYLYVKL